MINPIQSAYSVQKAQQGNLYQEPVTNIQPVSADNNRFIKGETARMEHLKSVYSEKALKQLGVIECETCSNRRYIDGSNDPGVSFKTPTHISPEQSMGAVIGHEMEHVQNEQAKAKSNNAEVVSQSVSIHRSVCPECGTSYVSGGLTKTVVKKPVKQIKTGELVDMKV